MPLVNLQWKMGKNALFFLVVQVKSLERRGILRYEFPLEKTFSETFFSLFFAVFKAVGSKSFFLSNS